MAAVSPSLLRCHFLQAYQSHHLLIYLAGHKRGLDCLLPTYYLLESYHHMWLQRSRHTVCIFSH